MGAEHSAEQSCKLMAGEHLAAQSRKLVMGDMAAQMTEDTVEGVAQVVEVLLVAQHLQLDHT